MPTFFTFFDVLQYKPTLLLQAKLRKGSSKHLGLPFLTFSSLQVCSVPSSAIATPAEDQWPRPLRMRTCTLLGLDGVRIIEVPDKQGPDNRGCTVQVVHLHNFQSMYAISLAS